MATTLKGISMARKNKNDLQPNDIAVILRPNLGEDKEWDSTFEVIVSGFGPVSISKEAMDDMIGMAVLLASVVPLMESNEEIAKEIMDHCNKFYAHNAASIEYNANHNSFSDIQEGAEVFNVDSPTVGRMQ